MNSNCDLLTPTLVTEAVFRMRARRAIPRTSGDSELEKLKARLLRQTLNDLAVSGAEGFIRHAANDAAAIAWDSPFPLLVFPTLFEERARAALAQVRHQVTVRRRSLELLAA